MAKCCEWLSDKCRQWYRDFFKKAALLMSGLIVSHTMAELSVLTTLFSYLMHNWENQHLPKAATVINIQQGLTTVLAIVVAYAADYYGGLFSMVIICNVSYIVGLALYWYSARFRSPNTDIRIFYATALAVALGRSGRLPVFKAFLADQFRDIEEKEINRPTSKKKEINRPTNFWWGTASFLAAIIAFALSPFTWATKFLISALFMVANLLLFLSGFTSYHHERPNTSPLDICFGVFRAAISKRHLNYPNTLSQYNWGNDVPSGLAHPSQIPSLPECSFLRWLDKAAIIEQTPSINPQEEEKLGRPYTVNQVKGVKHLLILIPMWMTFFAYGIVKATGRTFFIKQSSNMNVLIGEVKVPLMTFFVVKSLVSSTMTSLLDKMLKSAKQKKYELVAIGAGMVCSILCCITAWQVEMHRLNLVEKEGIGPSNPNKMISMSVFWLLPQFFLLGLMEGLASRGLEKFISKHVSKSMKKYGPIFSDFVTGFGNFFSIPFVLLCKSWFKDTINTSHLERYFLALAILCSVFLCIYLCVLRIYVRVEDLQEDMESDDQVLEDVPTAD